MSGPPSTKLSSTDGLTGPAVVCHVKEDGAKFSDWLKIGSSPQLSEFSVHHADPTPSHPEGTIILYIAGSEDTLTYTGSFDVEPVLTWVSSEGYPVVVALDQQTWNRALKSSTPLVTVFSDPTSEAPSFVTSVASQFKGKAIFSTHQDVKLLQNWQGSGLVLPTATVIIFSESNRGAVAWNEELDVTFDEAGLISFVNQVLEGTYVGNMKSEPIPEGGEPGSVVVLVGKNIKQVIEDQSKDIVLVEYYAPWCGHCKNLAPTYEKLAMAYKDAHNVVIAKIDATANTVRDDIQGYPTIMAFSKGNEEKYTGAHDVESLTAFVDRFLSKNENAHADL